MLVYTELLRQVIADVAWRVPELGHLDPDRIAVLASARGSSHPTGNLATCYGLHRATKPVFSIWTRGRSNTVVEVGPWVRRAVPRIQLGGREMHYMIMLRLPRLLLNDPLPIIIHELYHISEAFDRTLRPVRHGRQFDRAVDRLTRLWLDRARGDLPRLARMNLRQLQREFGSVMALGPPTRFTIPITEQVEPNESYKAALPRLYPRCRLALGYKVRHVTVTPADAPRTLTESDLVLRYYGDNGARRVPAPFARYAGGSDGRYLRKAQPRAGQHA